MIKNDNNFAIQEPNIPGWFSLAEMNMVYQSIVSARSTTCIEIGSYMGRSGYAICSALNSLGGARTVLCVDSFASPVSKEYYEREFMVTLMSKFPDVSKEYSNYHKYPRTLDCFNLTMERYPFMKKFVKIKECDSRSLELAGELFDFALIDGDHTYDGVKNDHIRVAPHLKTGGLVAFHDNSVHFPGVQQYISEVSKMDDLEKIGEAGHLVVFKKIR